MNDSESQAAGLPRTVAELVERAEADLAAARAENARLSERESIIVDFLCRFASAGTDDVANALHAAEADLARLREDLDPEWADVMRTTAGQIKDLRARAEAAEAKLARVAELRDNCRRAGNATGGDEHPLGFKYRAACIEAADALDGILGVPT